MSTATASPKEKISISLHKAGKGELSKALGISDKREEELCGEILDQAKNDETPIEKRIKMIAEKTNNHNELAWAMFAFGCHVSEGASNPMESLENALKNLISESKN